MPIDLSFKTTGRQGSPSSYNFLVYPFIPKWMRNQWTCSVIGWGQETKIEVWIENIMIIKWVPHLWTKKALLFESLLKIHLTFWESMLSPLITELYTYLYLPWRGGGLSISNFSPPNVQGYTLSWEVLNEHAYRKEKRGSLLQ